MIPHGSTVILLYDGGKQVATKARSGCQVACLHLKATFHLTISMRGQRATGKIQRNN